MGDAPQHSTGFPEAREAVLVQGQQGGSGLGGA